MKKSVLWCIRLQYLFVKLHMFRIFDYWSTETYKPHNYTELYFYMNGRL